MKIGIKIDPATGQRYMAVNAKGRALLLNPLTNKGTAYTHRERDELDLHGLVPPRFSPSSSRWSAHTRTTRRRRPNLERYIYLKPCRTETRRSITACCPSTSTR